jgi:hypothetical protein
VIENKVVRGWKSWDVVLERAKRWIGAKRWWDRIRNGLVNGAAGRDCAASMKKGSTSYIPLSIVNSTGNLFERRGGRKMLDSQDLLGRLSYAQAAGA